MDPAASGPAAPSAAGAEALRELRRAIEVGAVFLAASEHGPAELAAVSSAFSALGRADAAGDPGAWARAEEALLGALVAASGLPGAAAEHARAGALLRAAGTGPVSASADVRRRALRDYEALVGFLAVGDRESAAQIIGDRGRS